MKKDNSSYGPDRAQDIDDWKILIEKVHDLDLSAITQYRFLDLEARVLDFCARFDVLVSCELVIKLGLSDGSCDKLVKYAEGEMQDVFNETWQDWEDMTSLDAEEDEAEKERLRRVRNSLRSRGCYWLPYEVEPTLITDKDRAETLGFGGERSGATGKWRFKGTIGTGAWGHAGLWQQHDESQWLANRIVVKESYQGEIFDVPAFWEGEVCRKVIKEESITRYLSTLPNARNIVKWQGAAIYETMRMYRVYMEYCPHGDLEELIERCIARGEPIPERQLCAIFEALISALCLLCSGCLPGTEKDGHRTILHRNIKPANIFLGACHKEFWQGIPTAKLGDFGLATRMGDASSSHTGIGTACYRAPEQQVGAEIHRSSTNPGVCAASDLWAVARVMLSLMNLEPTSEVHPLHFESEQDLPVFRPGVEDRYRGPLCDVVRHCLNKSSADRPSAAYIWKFMQESLRLWKCVVPPVDEASLEIRRDTYALFACP